MIRMIMTQQFLSGCKNYFTNSKVVGSYIRFAYHEEQLLLYSSNKMCECISIPLRIMLPISTILRWLKNETNQIMLRTRGREQWWDTCSCEKRAGVRSCIPFSRLLYFLHLSTPTWESCDVHLWQIPGFEDHHGQSVSGRLVTQRDQQLPTTLGSEL